MTVLPAKSGFGGTAARNALAAGLARKIQKEFIFLPLDIFSTL